VETSLPGFDPDEVDISISENVLTIKGEKKHEEEKEEKGKYHYRERRYGAFQRTITLPAEVKAEAAEATFDKGELKLTMPKVEAAKAKRIEVKAN
jgi:HSP20 family protein